MTSWKTLLDSARALWRTTAGASSTQTDRAPAGRPIARVPAEYLALYTYLDHRYATSVVLTFEQMEALLGFALPLRARQEPEWWSAAAPRTDGHVEAWMGAGRIATPNLPAGIVTFDRV